MQALIHCNKIPKFCYSTYPYCNGTVRITQTKCCTGVIAPSLPLVVSLQLSLQLQNLMTKATVFMHRPLQSQIVCTVTTITQSFIQLYAFFQQTECPPTYSIHLHTSYYTKTISPIRHIIFTNINYCSQHQTFHPTNHSNLEVR